MVLVMLVGVLLSNAHSHSKYYLYLHVWLRLAASLKAHGRSFGSDCIWWQRLCLLFVVLVHTKKAHQALNLVHVHLYERSCISCAKYEVYVQKPT